MRLAVALPVLFWAPTALGQVVVGYQLGLTQSVGGTFGDDPVQLQAQAQQAEGALEPRVCAVDADCGLGQICAQQACVNGAATLPVAGLQGVQLNTNVTANLTVDLVTRVVNHGFVFGVNVGQLVPTAVPETAQAVLRQRTTTLAANATYLARMEQGRWQLQWGAGYLFGLNGRLDSGADGTVGALGGTLPAASAGAFAFNGITHTANAQAQGIYTRARWDLTLGMNYVYAQNGIFNTAIGAPGAQGQAGAIGANLGSFIVADIQTFGPAVGYRTRLGRRGLLTSNLTAVYSLAAEPQDNIDIEGTQTRIVRATPPAPETLLSTLRIEYQHTFGQERFAGVELNSTLGFRVPIDPLSPPQPVPGATLGLDTLINLARLTYRDFVRSLELQLIAGAGVGQAWLFQPPGGQVPPGFSNDDFVTVRSRLVPVFDLTLQRRFEPIDLALTLNRGLTPGVLGASAVVVEAAGLTVQHVAEFGERRVVSNMGVNANRTRGAGGDLFVAPAGVTAPLTDAQGFGVNAGLATPVFAEESFAVDLAATYNFNWAENAQFPAPFRTHVALLTLRGTYGRGSAQAASGAGGRLDSDELDAFSANPATGAPLVSQRLLQQGAPMLQPGRAPGQPAAQRRDSRQSYQQSIRQEQMEREARERQDVVQSVGAYQDEERRAQERAKKEQEAKAEERKREEGLGDWPVQPVPLPQEPPPQGP